MLLLSLTQTIMAAVLITGGTGLIGKALSPMLLRKGYEVIILTRNPAKASNKNLSIQEYFAFEDANEIRHEFINGNL